MSDDDQKQMEKLKDRAIYETDPRLIRSAIDALASYGKESVNFLQEVVDSPVVDNSLKVYALDKIKYAKF